MADVGGAIWPTPEMPEKDRSYTCDTLYVGENVAGSAAIRLDNLLMAQPQWLTSYHLQMAGRNVYLSSGLPALYHTTARSWIV